MEILNVNSFYPFFLFVWFLILFLVNTKVEPLRLFPFKNYKSRVQVNLVTFLISQIFMFFLGLLLLPVWSGGFFNVLDLNFYLEASLSVIFLDMAIYWQHRFFHKSDFFWRFHQIHHRDMAFSTTTALRFHFGEIIFSYIWKMLLVFSMGIDWRVYLFFEFFLSFALSSIIQI